MTQVWHELIKKMIFVSNLMSIEITVQKRPPVVIRMLPMCTTYAELGPRDLGPLLSNGPGSPCRADSPVMLRGGLLQAARQQCTGLGVPSQANGAGDVVTAHRLPPRLPVPREGGFVFHESLYQASIIGIQSMEEADPGGE